MKNITILLLVANLSGCFNQPKMETGLEGKSLPSFNLLLADSITYFNTNNIPEGKSFVLFYFSPQCSFCKAQIESIIKEMKSLKDIHFYLVTTAPFLELKSFYKDYQLKEFSNITVGLDYTSYFLRYFKTNSVPYLAIYDSNKRLKQALLGKTDINIIKDVAIK